MSYKKTNMQVFKKLSHILLLFLLSGYCLAASGQNLDTIPHNDIFDTFSSNKGESGDIRIFQPASLHVLLDKNIRLNKEDGTRGYRIQIYSSSGQYARERAEKVADNFCIRFPEFDPDRVYIIYPVPFFKVRIGDFRTRSEANAFYYEVKEYFPNSYIVKSKIKFPENILPDWQKDITLE
jgi:hypothetical protein